MTLKERFSQPGYVVSGLVHAGVLGAILLAFSTTEKFDDQQETVPIEVVTDNQFNQIMKGDHSAKAVRPDATAERETVASAEVAAPEPSPAVPPPPPPPPPPPEATAEPPPLPAPRPVPPPPSPRATPPVPTPPVRDVEAEPVLPKPVPKTPVRPPPTPPVVTRPIVRVHEIRPLPPKPKPFDRPRPDLIARLVDTQPPAEITQAQPTPKPVVHTPKPAPAPEPDKPLFDLTDITKLLSRDTPAAAKPAASRELSHLASLGSPTASAPKMSPSFWAGLDGLLEDQYRTCWSYLGLASGAKYIPQVRVMYGLDGSLQGQPTLVNPPSDPAMRSLADSALRAVRKCNPLRIPEQYAPYYEEWKGRVLRFDPEEMAG